MRLSKKELYIIDVCLNSPSKKYLVDNYLNIKVLANKIEKEIDARAEKDYQRYCRYN